MNFETAICGTFDLPDATISRCPWWPNKVPPNFPQVAVKFILKQTYLLYVGNSVFRQTVQLSRTSLEKSTFPISN